MKERRLGAGRKPPWRAPVLTEYPESWIPVFLPPDIDKILDAVGAVLNDLGKAELLADLEGAMSLHRFGVGLRHQPAVRGRRMAKLKKDAAAIKHEFAGDARFRALCRELDRVNALTETNWLSNLLGYGRDSAFENLVWGLVSIFRNHFPKLPLFTRDPDDASNVAAVHPG